MNCHRLLKCSTNDSARSHDTAGTPPLQCSSFSWLTSAVKEKTLWEEYTILSLNTGICVCLRVIDFFFLPRILNKFRSDHKGTKVNTSLTSEELLKIARWHRIVLPWCSRVQLNIANMLWLSSLVASACCVGSWTYKNRPVQVVSVTCLYAHPREAIQAKGMNAIGRVFKTCLKHSYGNMKFTFCDDFLDGHLMSSNSKHSSDEAATAAGTSAPSTDSWARPGAHQLPAWIKKFLHFPRG